jgi:hypothetical protein
VLAVRATIQVASASRRTGNSRQIRRPATSLSLKCRAADDYYLSVGTAGRADEEDLAFGPDLATAAGEPSASIN